MQTFDVFKVVSGVVFTVVCFLIYFNFQVDFRAVKYSLSPDLKFALVAYDVTQVRLLLTTFVFIIINHYICSYHY